MVLGYLREAGVHGREAGTRPRRPAYLATEDAGTAHEADPRLDGRAEAGCGLGAIASEQFDINIQGLQFVSTLLGFLCMDEEALGFDPTFTTTDGTIVHEGPATRRQHPCLTIQRGGDDGGHTERFVLDRVIRRAPCIAGRATTCWRAYREDDPAKRPFVIKDSWQFTERDEEGELLQTAAERGVLNVARYYHHETVCVRGHKVDIRDNLRQGLDMSTASNFKHVEEAVASTKQSVESAGASPQQSIEGIDARPRQSIESISASNSQGSLNQPSDEKLPSKDSQTSIEPSEETRSSRAHLRRSSSTKLGVYGTPTHLPENPPNAAAAKKRTSSVAQFAVLLSKKSRFSTEGPRSGSRSRPAAAASAASAASAYPTSGPIFRPAPAPATFDERYPLRSPEGSKRFSKDLDIYRLNLFYTPFPSFANKRQPLCRGRSPSIGYWTAHLILLLDRNRLLYHQIPTINQAAPFYRPRIVCPPSVCSRRCLTHSPTIQRISQRLIPAIAPALIQGGRCGPG